MKKISPLTFLSALLFLSPVLSFAREEAPTTPLPAPQIQGEVPGADVPFQVSVSPGKWSQAKVGKIFTAGYHPSDFVLPTLKGEPAPIRYPRWAVQEGWEGTFIIAIEVLKSGEVGRWNVMQSTGYSLLDETAGNAIRQWHFHPGTELGKSVVMCIQIPVHFVLRDSD